MTRLKLYKNTTKKLTEELFDCVSEYFSTFLKALKDRALDHDWMDCARILDIARDLVDVLTATGNIRKNYGNISLVSIWTLKEFYIDRQVRPAQDMYSLYTCLMNYISGT